MKIIFLDIDGVLNHQDYYTKGRDCETYPLSEICCETVKILNHIIGNTDAKIVISSTWRIGRSLDEMRNIFREKGLVGEIINFTPSLEMTNESLCRGNEIQQYLLSNKLYKYDSYRNVDYDYAIIDDDTDMLYQQRHNFFETSPMHGLTMEIAEKIISHLNHKPETD